MSYTTQHLAVMFGRSKATIRNWAIEFAGYLSPTATPEEGKIRFFTADDLAVFSLIADYKDREQTYEQIHLALKSGARGEPPDLSEYDMHSISTSDRERRVTLEVEALQRTIVQLRIDLQEAREKSALFDQVNLENVRLKTSLEHTQQELENSRNQAQERMVALQKQLDQAQKRIEELALEAGREAGKQYARGFMDAMRDKGELPQINNDR
jgi:DNA-binding transcriptional MerR regulator